MEKRHQYRFSIMLDETDPDHRRAGDYLNRLGRKKARVVVKAILAYLDQEKEVSAVQKSEVRRPKKPDVEKQIEKTDRMLSIDINECSINEAEVALMRKNFDKLGHKD